MAPGSDDDVSAASLRVLTWMPPEMTRRITQDLDGVEVIRLPVEGPLPADAQGEVLLVGARSVPTLEAALRRGVRWVHVYGTGVDGFPFNLLQEGQTVTCSRGVSGVPIAEWVLAMMLAFEKRLPDVWIHEPPARRRDPGLGALTGKTLGLVGLGGIGAAVAARALSFDMRVLALRRRPKPSELPGVDTVTELGELLPEADHLVLAAPATRATRHLIDAAALSQVKPGLHLVNVARGALLDQEALREALDDGRVAMASLDTVDPEPPPAGHWLYSHPQVRLSPHVSWSMPQAQERIVGPFIENLRRYVAGEPLAGVVDVEEGY